MIASINPTMKAVAGTQTGPRPKPTCGFTGSHWCLGPNTNPNGNRQCVNADKLNAARTTVAGGTDLVSNKARLKEDERADLQKRFPTLDFDLKQMAYSKVAKTLRDGGEYEEAKVWEAKAQSGAAGRGGSRVPQSNPTLTAPAAATTHPRNDPTRYKPTTKEEADATYRAAVERAEAENDSTPAPPKERERDEYVYGVTVCLLVVDGVLGYQVNLGWKGTKESTREGQQVSTFYKRDGIDRSNDFTESYPGSRKDIEEYRWMDYVAIEATNASLVYERGGGRGEEFWVSLNSHADFMRLAKGLVAEMPSQSSLPALIY